MGKSLLAFTLLVLISTSAAADYSFIGLYVNAEHEIYAYCPASAMQPIEMWIWCHPGPNGQIGADFRVDYPMNLVQCGTTWNNTLIVESLGYLETGFSVIYHECQHDWHWICHQNLLITDVTLAYIRIDSHPDFDECHILSCLDRYPIEPAQPYPFLHFNDPCPPGP